MSTRHAPFDDSYMKSRRRATEDQNTPTVGFDAYRQGVELTTSKHYAQGIVKIHSGYNGQDGDHTVPQFVYGQTQTVFLDELYHCDVVPSTLVNFFDRTESMLGGVIDRGTDLDVSVRNFDGVIEPFDIRDVVARKETVRRYGHQLCAALGEGNVTNRNASDVFMQIVKNTDVHVGTFAMTDTSDHFGDISTISESLSSDGRRRAPFIEDYPKKGTEISSNMEDDMTTALNNMQPCTVNMLPNGYSQFGSSGFDY